MPPKCTCQLVLAGDTAWYASLCDEIKVSLPDNFVVDVHNTVRGLGGLVWCGKFVTYAGNYKNRCPVRIALAEKFPYVFIPDASGRESNKGKIRQEK